MPIAVSVQDYLDRNSIEYGLIVHSPTRGSTHSAQAAHVPGDCLAKSVLLEDDNGYLMAVLPASHRLDLPAIDRELNRELALTPEHALENLFKDCEVGAIPPLGQAYGIDVLIDRSLADIPDVYFEAGDHSSLIHVSGADFRKLMANSTQRHISHHL
jgi:Ala-tRNA(Pro) deacylase